MSGSDAHLAVRSDRRDAAFVFLHGFSGAVARTWKRFPDLLVEDRAFVDWDVHALGYASSLRPDVLRRLWTADADLATLSVRFATALRDLDLPGTARLVILAHSMGGLVVQRALLDDTDLARRVDRVVLFGTPSAGLAKASTFRWAKMQIEDMAEDGPFIRALRRDREAAAPRPFPVHAVAGERDRFVPPDSSLLDVFDTRDVVPGDHLSIVKPRDDGHPSYRLVRRLVLEGAFERGPLDAARVAVQRGRFQEAVGQLAAAAAAGELGDGDAVVYALALDGTGRREEAIACLEARGQSSTDAMGTLAGRIKRRYLAEHREPDGRRARELYEHACERAAAVDHHDQAHYHAINVAFLSFFLADPTAPGAFDEARAWSERALAHAERAADPWRHASRAEALLHLGRSDEALAAYGEALGTLDEPWQVRSMWDQARAWLEAQRDDGTIEQLEGLVRRELGRTGDEA